MPLRFDLGPNEKLHIGTATITGGRERTRFTLDGDMPILRDRDFLPPESAATATERLYCRLQKIYLEGSFTAMLGSYLTAMTQAVESAPERAAEFNDANDLVMAGDLYRGLRALKALIRPEAFAKDGAATPPASARAAVGRFVSAGPTQGLPASGRG